MQTSPIRQAPHPEVVVPLDPVPLVTLPVEVPLLVLPADVVPCR
jgi:hypothetical protein